MEAKELAIQVNNVYKDFLLPHERANSLKTTFTGLLQGKKGSTVERQHALKNIDFEIQKGEFFGIVGRNGSGKSTLLKILARIYQPTKGSVTIHGRLVPFIELGVGFNPELTGKENIYLSAALMGFSRKEIDAMYSDIVEFAELEKFMDQKLKNYSSGMQVRLAFSMAIRAESDILLIDEVLAVGDADFQRKCFEYFKYLKKTKTTVVFVSHDMNAVREYCDRAVLIEKNEVQQIGKANEIAEEYLKLFSDEPSPLQHAAHKDDDRWGDGKVQVTKVTSTITNELVTINLDIIANEDTDEFVVGFRIRNTDGTDVTGTNTKKEKIKLNPLKVGNTLRVTCVMPNVLSDGSYFIDPSIVYPNEITVFDWWNEAAMFSVKKNRNLPYVVDPGFVITQKNLK